MARVCPWRSMEASFPEARWLGRAGVPPTLCDTRGRCADGLGVEGRDTDAPLAAWFLSPSRGQAAPAGAAPPGDSARCREGDASSPPQVTLDLIPYENIAVKRVLDPDQAFLEKLGVSSLPSCYMIYPNGSHGLINM